MRIALDVQLDLVHITNMLNAATTVDIYRANAFVRRCSRVEAAGYIQNLVSRGYGSVDEYVISDAAALAAEVTAWISAWDKVESEIRSATRA